MRALKCLALCLILLCGCSLVEVTKTSYKRDLPDLPQKEQITVDDIGAVAVGGTEINKGLMELKVLFTLAEDIEPAKFIEHTKEFLPRLEILTDFSYSVMGFLGVAWSKIDWDNPEEFFKQAEEKQKAMESALKNEKARSLQLEKDVDDFMKKLATTEKAVKDKAGEIAANDGKWSAKLTWVWSLIKFIVGGFILAGLAWWLCTSWLKKKAGMPWKLALFGGKKIAKTGVQIIKGLQGARVDLDDEIKNGGTPEEKAGLQKAWEILHKNIADHRDTDDVQVVIDAVKKANHVKQVTPDL